MNWRMLILRSESILSSENRQYKIGSFNKGALWMKSQLDLLREPHSEYSISVIAFNRYGILKYGISSIFALIPLFFLSFSLLSVLCSITVFYWVEILFLFLFPLLIDRDKHPFKSNFTMIRKIGMIKCLLNVLPIAIYMLLGLFNFKKPFYAWYVGCLSILILYVDETTAK